MFTPIGIMLSSREWLVGTEKNFIGVAC